MDDGHLTRIARARARLDRARADLLTEIRGALDAGLRPSQIGNAAKFSREYIAKIRDGKTGKRTP